MHMSFGLISMHKKLIFLVLILGVYANVAPGQSNRTELSFAYGISNYQGDLVDSDFFIPGESNFAGSARLAMPVHRQWVVRGGLSYMRFTGTDLNAKRWRDKEPVMSFSTRLYEVAARLEWYPFGPRQLRLYSAEELATERQLIKPPGKYTSGGAKIAGEQDGFFVIQKEQGVRVLLDERGSRWTFDPAGRLLEYEYRDAFQPFFFAGAAWARFNADTRARMFSGESLPVEPQLERERVVLPFGAGIRYEFHADWSIQGEAGWRYTGTDYIDGFSQSRNPDADDWYFFMGIGVNYALGTAPTPQVAPADSDGDGIPDLTDECPFNEGSASLQGCPDTDGDGVSDKTDACPEEPGPIVNDGCPEQDTDQDGILDAVDKCPDQPGVERLQGCPEEDQDEDGVPDDQDECPLVKGDRAMNGCPDADEDGIPDYRDDCPGEYGLEDYNGCPTPGEGQVSQLLNGIPAIRFAEGSRELEAAARAILNRVALFLQQYPQYKLQITGHADELAATTANHRLSVQRAQASRQYLLSKGISPQRLFYEGVGDEQLVTPRQEKSNRLNRRVSFTLFR